MELIIKLDDDIAKGIRGENECEVEPREIVRSFQATIADAIANGTPYNETDKWISVKERLPEELEPVNITWINHDPEPYYKEIKGKPFTATGVYFNGQWYWWSTLCTDILAEYSHNFDDIIDTAIEVTAWKPLPEPYESEEK